MDTDPAALLRIYDDQLRTDAETPGAASLERLGPLRLATFPGGRGFVSYRDLGGADAATVRGWVGEVRARFAADPAVTDVEWKTRGHDVAPGLHDALVDHGFVPGEVESVMMGPAAGLAVDVPLPEDVTLRRVTTEEDVRAMSAAADEAFGDPVSSRRADDLLFRLARDPDMELWVAEAGGRIVSSGRLEPVPSTQVAGVWGGATLPGWRGRGIYRALTAERARSALRLGKTVLHSDSTEYSRPILERSGLVRVTTTTPYEWTR
ncbi:GNAT family N-acetyltransferase [Phycicoccus sonneratiae]|uniref:GNAT family N-acetyltransferase n=1 Tax=Phycicoccus sonneratiae TaxID=2807628 RepID=A0ABS2CQF6_9MICO|nr:GNAT family N-acetyltransferase [Phycicoccus sonneraticus]MBM6402111.1 GNAT family N-acetyltransferase [Phycicoccus sonneraticus]